MSLSWLDSAIIAASPSWARQFVASAMGCGRSGYDDSNDRIESSSDIKSIATTLIPPLSCEAFASLAIIVPLVLLLGPPLFVACADLTRRSIARVVFVARRSISIVASVFIAFYTLLILAARLFTNLHRGFGLNPFVWVRAQWALIGLLQLEANHLRDIYWSAWLGLEGDDAYKGGLRHVDTAAAHRINLKSKNDDIQQPQQQPVQKSAATATMMAATAPNQPTVRDVVLIGGGHAHAFVLKMFGMKPLPGVKLTLITRDVMTPYSGMLPGFVAGLYTAAECHIDLVRLARFAKARLIHAEAKGIEAGRVILGNGRPAVAFDVLSINIGSAPRPVPGVAQRSSSSASSSDENNNALIHTTTEAMMVPKTKGTKKQQLQDKEEESDISSLTVAQLHQHLRSYGSAGVLYSRKRGRKAELRAQLRSLMKEEKEGKDIDDTTAGAVAAAVPAAASQCPVTPVKPIDGFRDRWNRIRARVRHEVLVKQKTVTLTVVGGGAGGVELTLAMQERLLADLSKHDSDSSSSSGRGGGEKLLRVMLVTRGSRLMTQHSAATAAIFERILRQRGVTVLLSHAVERVESSTLIVPGAASADTRRIPFDECIWCTQAGAQEWLRKNSALSLDEGGFIRVTEALESVNQANIFAAGDVASLPSERPKAGVFAVRAGPILAHNIRQAVLGRRRGGDSSNSDNSLLGRVLRFGLGRSSIFSTSESAANSAAGSLGLRVYRPQRTFLGIIGTGRRSCAVASVGALAVDGAWLWELKDWIDRKWMAGYTHDLPRMQMPSSPVPEVAHAAGPDALQALSHASMRCGGCGAKVGATVLSRVMQRLRPRLHQRPIGEVLVGLDAPDDAAIVSPLQAGLVGVHTVDFFRAFIDDPYVFGQVAANHALSDCHAMCAEARTALAVAVVPYAVEAKVEESLFQMMAGACEALRESGCALVGGHTCEGVELALGFAVNGAVKREHALTKGGMVPGQVIILTKPVGTGTLFAAEMRMRARGEWIAAAVDSMRMSNRKGALCLRRHGATSCTDVTGFGVAGHLLEMLKASDAAAELLLDRVPLLPGALACVRAGVFSSLQPANLRLKRGIVNERTALQHPVYPLLFDPQTAGGLLASVPADNAEECVRDLHAMGYVKACVVGRVVEPLTNKADETSGGAKITCLGNAMSAAADETATTATTDAEDAPAYD
eukprot:UC1_evm1s1442